MMPRYETVFVDKDGHLWILADVVHGHMLYTEKNGNAISVRAYDANWLELEMLGQLDPHNEIKLHFCYFDKPHEKEAAE